MLIECSECKNQVSDKAEFCPKCGCPILAMSIDNCCNINGINYDFSDIIDILPKIGQGDNDIHPYYIIGMIRDKTPLNPVSSEELANIILETKQIPNSYNGTIEQKMPPSNTPHCPICNSTDLSKITTTKKAAKIVAFGTFGMGDNGKMWKCNSCGSKF